MYVVAFHGGVWLCLFVGFFGFLAFVVVVLVVFCYWISIGSRTCVCVCVGMCVLCVWLLLFVLSFVSGVCFWLSWLLLDGLCCRLLSCWCVVSLVSVLVLFMLQVKFGPLKTPHLI